MTLVPVLTAVSDPRLEADVAAALAGGRGLLVARRCIDLAELLSVAAAGAGRVAVVSSDLRRLDGEALTRLAVEGVAVVGLLAPGDDDAERRLRQLGVGQLVRVEDDVVAAVLAAVAAGPASRSAHDWSTAGRSSLPPVPYQADSAEGGAGLTAEGEAPTDLDVSDGQVVAVWGPTGAPGRTTVAVTLAAELAALGQPTLLVDADVHGGVVGQVLGLLDEAPGLAAACRLATAGTLDAEALAVLAPVVRPGFRVLTGIPRADRWPELRPSALAAVLALSRRLARVVVVDCAFSLERDEELSYDTAAPRRHGATLEILESADVVVGVAAADPVGLHRYVRALGELTDAVNGCTPVTVVNRVRRSAVGGGDPHEEIGAALRRFAGVAEPRWVPLDVAGVDAALAAGRTLAEAAPRSPARLALQGLARELAGVPADRARRWRRSAPRAAQARSR